MSSPSRWHAILDQKPRPILEHLLDEVAQLLAKELRQWPPQVESLDVATGGQFSPLLEPSRPRPSPTAYREGFKLARWELDRELDAVDDYMRNRRYLEVGLAPDDKLTLLFLSRWMLEQLLGLKEATEGRVDRPALARCLDRAERRFFDVPTDHV